MSSAAELSVTNRSSSFPSEIFWPVKSRWDMNSPVSLFTVMRVEFVPSLEVNQGVYFPNVIFTRFKTGSVLQTRIVSSLPEEMSRLPSGENATDQISNSWLRRVAVSVQFFVSQSLIV